MRKLVLGALASAVCILGATAADVAGLWKASFTPPDGHHHESTLDLQVEGDKVTGKISSKRGSVPITDGKVNGNAITFTVNRKGNGDDITVTFTGTVEMDTMKLKMQYGERPPVPLIARRAS
jgi:hypothetical protein